MNSDLYPANPVLLVDDEIEALMGCEFMLESAGITHLRTCQDSRQVLALMAQEQMGAVLLDLSMPFVSGQELLQQLVEKYPEVPVIILTGMNKIETAIDCMRAGAFDYLVKPVEDTGLIAALKRALELRELRLEYSSFKDRVFSNKLDHPEAFAKIVTTNPRMQALFQYMETVAGTSRPVLITGETGTGKELIAQALHYRSARAAKPLVAVNCAALNANLIESELFGHEKGAFTGALTTRRGRFEEANGGTLFLDEIGETSLEFQAKLLRVLQEEEFERIGSGKTLRVDVRILASTNRDLRRAIGEGRFREDLFYRLSVIPVNLPPLRERGDDIRPLATHFVEVCRQRYGGTPRMISEEGFRFLEAQPWRGNVRELQHTIERAFVLSCRETLGADDFHSIPGEGGKTGELDDALPIYLDGKAREHILNVLDRTGWRKKKAADILGIDRATLYRMLKKYSITENSG